MFGPMGNEVADLLPPETLELINLLQQQQYLAYSYRQNGGRMYYPGMMGQQSQQTVQLPGSVDMSRSFAVAHLRNLAETVSEARKAQLVEAMRRAEVVLPDVLMALPAGIRGMRMLPPTLMEDYGDEPAVAGLWIMRYTDDSSAPDPAVAKKCYEMFKADRPQLALMAALIASRSGKEEDQKLLTEALKLVPASAEVNPVFMMAVAQTVGAGMGMRPGMAGGGLPDALRQTLSERMRAWYPHMKQMQGQGGYRTWVFMMTASVVANSKDIKPFIELMNYEVDRWRKSGNHNGTGFFGFYPRYAGGGGLAQPLTFPPQQLTDFPSHVMQLFVTAPNGPRVPGQEPDGLNAEALGKHLDLAKDPVLKLLLAQRAGKSDVVKATIDKLMEAKKPTVDAYLLAAAYAANEEEDLERAVQLLDKARYLAMSSQMRQRLDSAIVAWALEQSDDESIQQAGQAAALRLRRGQLAPEQRQQLASIMEELGLDKEAEQLQQQATQPGATAGAFGSGFMGGMQQQQQIGQRIQKMLSNDEREKARDLARRYLERTAQAQMTLQGGNMNDWELRQVIEQLNTSNLAKEVLEQAKVDDDASYSRRLRYARVCELLSQPDKAKELYKQLLTERPKQVTLLLQLAMLTADDKPKDGAAYLDQIPDREWMNPLVPQRLMASVNAYEDEARS